MLRRDELVHVFGNYNDAIMHVNAYSLAKLILG